MSAESATLAGRAAAEAQMLDSCLITRGGGSPVWDEATGTWSTPAGTTVYSGPCKLQTRDVQAANPDVAGSRVTLVDWTVHLPVDGSGAVRQGDLITMTTCQLDAAAVGRTFTVTGPHLGTAKTARRLPVKAEVESWT